MGKPLEHLERALEMDGQQPLACLFFLSSACQTGEEKTRRDILLR